MAEPHGRLDLTPWARQAIPESLRPGIAARIPAGYSLWVSTSNKRQYTCRLTARGGLIAQTFGILPDALERCLAAAEARP